MNFSKLNWLLELKRQVDIAADMAASGLVKTDVPYQGVYEPPKGCNARIGDFGILVPERFTREGVEDRSLPNPNWVDANTPEPVCRYEPDTSKELWWCNSHHRRATHIARHPGFCIDGTHQCDPKLPGILLPCACVNLTGIAEIEEGETEPHFPNKP